MKKRLFFATLAGALVLVAWFVWRQAGGVSHAEIHDGGTKGTAAILARVDVRGDRVEARVDGVEEKLDRIEAKLDKILELATRPLPDGMKPAR